MNVERGLVADLVATLTAQPMPSQVGGAPASMEENPFVRMDIVDAVVAQLREHACAANTKAVKT